MTPCSSPGPHLIPTLLMRLRNSDTLTPYDHEHHVTYLRILDAEADEADWTEVARIVLHIDPTSEPARARRAWDSHLARAKWMTAHGYKLLLSGNDNY
jgi:hypothetical protein